MRAPLSTLGLVFALAGCAASPPPSPALPALDPPPAPLTQERIAALLTEVSQIRGLPQRAPIPIHLLDEQSFLAALAERTERRTASAELEAQKAFHLAFDLLPDESGPGAKGPSTTREVLEEQVLGFYDHERKTIIVRAKPATTEAEAEKARGILAHEIEHALQDQYFGRPSAAAAEAMTDDAQLAYSSLLEGDAMLTMFAYLAAERGVPFQRMVRRTADLMRDVPAERFLENDGDAALFRALPIVRERLLFRYHAGTGMVAELYRAGGLDLVNHMFSSPPVSTEQVIHPEKYLQGETPISLPPPEPPSGFRALGSGTLGELETRVVLERCTKGAAQVAAGWGGDRYTLAAGPGGGVGLLWSTAWDTEKDAAELEAALLRNPGCLRALSLGQTSVEGTLVVRSRQTRVAVVRGLPAPLAEEAAERILATPLPPEGPRVALPVALLPRVPLPTPSPGFLSGRTYLSPWLGVMGAVPLGLYAIVGKDGLELRVNRPDVLVNGALFLSDITTTPPFLEKLFDQVARGVAAGTEGKRLVVMGGGPAQTPLGTGVERRYSVEGTPILLRVVVVPICGGTGSLVFLQSWADPSAKGMLDAFLYSFRWNTSVKPPVCEMLDPR